MEKVKDNRPLVVHFENGPLIKGAEKKFEFEFLKQENNSKRMKLCASNGEAHYCGDIPLKQNCDVKNYICFINKTTKKIERIEEVRTCTLKPNLKEDKTLQNNSNEETNLEKSDRLAESFGSSRQKRAVASRKKKSGESADLLTKKVGELAKTLHCDTSTLEVTTPKSDFIPVKNEHATDPADIYNVNDIISRSSYIYLTSGEENKSSFSVSEFQTWKKDNIYPECILQLFGNILDKHEEIKKRKGAYIVFLSYLLKIYNLTHKDMRNLKQCIDIPQALYTELIGKYTKTDDKKTFFPGYLKDRVLLDIFILCLHIQEFQCDISPIMKHLNLGLPKAKKLLIALGCSISPPKLKRRHDSDGPDESTFMVSLRLKSERKMKIKAEPLEDKNSLSIDAMMDEINHLVNG